ncbi:MAG: metal ABC transporter substrate-binding protein [Chloroflexota bacterium]|nr:metal ABC transporter substrate-binding protein [Chloroflexota bacterium]
MAIVLMASACGSSSPEQTATGTRLPVVTTTALLADMVKNVGGELVDVTALVPPGADVHSFQSTPADNVTVSSAAMVVSNGGGLDQFLDRLIHGSASDDAVRVFAAGTLLELGPDRDDPHFWQNPAFAVKYAEGIRDGLVAADPENSDEYEANFDSYADALTKLDFDIESTLNTIQSDRRHLITFHDAFGHFARRYSWQITSLVSSDASQVSPGPVVEILERVKTQGIPAIFAEPQFNSGLLLKAAEEAGVEVGPIYSDVQEGEAASYIDMMLFNAKSLARLLR